MANELDIVAGGVKISMTASNTGGGVGFPPLTISKTIKGKIKSRPKSNKLLDGRTIQHGQEFKFDCDIWDTSFELLSQLRDRQDETMNVTLISPVSAHLFKDVNIMVSENKKFESSGKAQTLKLEFGTNTEANVTASIRNILRETGSMNIADPNNPQMPRGWTSGSGNTGIPSLKTDPSGSGNIMFWSGSETDDNYEVRKQFPVADKFKISLSTVIMASKNAYNTTLEFDFFDNSNSSIWKHSEDLVLSEGSVLNYNKTFDIALPTQSADFRVKFTDLATNHDFFHKETQIEMGHPSPFVPR